MALCYVGFGSNRGWRVQNIRYGLQALMKLGKLGAVSSLYSSPPLGFEGRSFLNGTALLETALEPSRLLRALKAVEQQSGRTKGEESRPLDLDILLYDEVVSTEPSIPHPRIGERPFVIKPLEELFGRGHPDLNYDSVERLSATLPVVRVAGPSVLQMEKEL